MSIKKVVNKIGYFDMLIKNKIKFGVYVDRYYELSAPMLVLTKKLVSYNVCNQFSDVISCDGIYPLYEYKLFLKNIKNIKSNKHHIILLERLTYD